MKKLIIIALLVIVGVMVWSALRGQREGQPTGDHLAGRNNAGIADSNNVDSKREAGIYDTSQSLTKASSTERTRIEPLEINDISPVDDEWYKFVNDEMVKRIKHIENYGIFSRAAQVHPSIQEALLKSEEYQKGVELHRLAEEHQKNNEAEEADRNYRLADKHFLKAATQHLEADISICTFRAGLILRRMNHPDYETAYMLFKYTLVISPKGNMAVFSNDLINEIRDQNLLSQEKMQELDKRIDKIQSVAEFLEDEDVLRTFRHPTSLPPEENK